MFLLNVASLNDFILFDLSSKSSKTGNSSAHLCSKLLKLFPLRTSSLRFIRFLISLLNNKSSKRSLVIFKLGNSNRISEAATITKASFSIDLSLDSPSVSSFKDLKPSNALLVKLSRLLSISFRQSICKPSKAESGIFTKL
jgi:hypothetical protein